MSFLDYFRSHSASEYNPALGSKEAHEDVWQTKLKEANDNYEAAKSKGHSAQIEEAKRILDAVNAEHQEFLNNSETTAQEKPETIQ